MFRRTSAVLASGTVLAVAYTLGKDEFLPKQLQRQSHQHHPSQPQFNTILPTRTSLLQKLKSEDEFDLLVIGGGATGAGIALDASLRGLSVALVERDDYSSGTSSKSTKLIHGGVRYLEKAFLKLDYEQFLMVKEALHERATLLQIAPHLTYELPFILPLTKWWQVPYYWLGCKVYDIVAGRKLLKSSYYLNKNRTIEHFPLLKKENLKGAMVYYDGQSNDSRMNLAIILTAIIKGAVASNYVEVQSLIKNGENKVVGANVIDALTGEKWKIKAKGVINATGPFTDSIRKMDVATTKEIVAPSLGSHIVLPSFYCPSKMGLLDPATSDGRVIFLLPWEGSTLVGTTDIPCDIVKDPQASEDEISWMLKELSNYLSSDIQIRRNDVLASWSGIRPLVKDPSKPNTESLARNHIVDVSESDLITVSGGKWTTYRAMASDAVDKAISVFGLKSTGPVLTEKEKLIGAHGYTENMYITLAQDYNFDLEVAKNLSHSYGDQAKIVANIGLNKKLVEGYPYIESEVIYSVKKEYACKISDFISRRIRLAFLNSKAANSILEKVADLMGKELNWTQEQKAKEIQLAREFLKTMGL